MIRLYFDFDETLVKSCMAFLEVWHERNFFAIREGEIKQAPHWSEIKTWSFSEVEDMHDKELYDIFADARFFDNLAWHSDEDAYNMRDVLEFFCKHPMFDVYIATKGCLDNISFKRLWLAKNAPFFKQSKLIGMIDRVMDKSALVGLYDGISVLIDDHQDNILSVSKNMETILMAHKGRICDWNEKIVHEPSQRVARGCKDLQEQILKMLE